MIQASQQMVKRVLKTKLMSLRKYATKNESFKINKVYYDCKFQKLYDAKFEEFLYGGNWDKVG